MTLDDGPASHNMCFDIEWQCHIAEAESQIGSSVPRIKFSAKSPLHLKAQARYAKLR
jgi:hypothetical protein